MLDRLKGFFLPRSVPKPIRPLMLPPPYRKMLAINSDVEFTTWSNQLALMRLFAERGLETAHSFWFFCDPAGTWRLFEDDLSWSEEGRAALPLLRAGVLDTLHAFGGVLHFKGNEFDRSQIASGYDRLEGEGVRVSIFSNHGTTSDTQNLGGTAWSGQPGTGTDYQKGDVVGDRRYHLDRTLAHGVKFFWVDIDRSRQQYVFQPSFGRDLGLEPESLFVPQTFREGTPGLRFRRTDCALDPDAVNLGAQINRILAAPQSGFSVIYNHLGVTRSPEGKPLQNPRPFFNQDTYDALDALAESQRRGEVLVTTTERLLFYALLQTIQPWREVENRKGHRVIEVDRYFDAHGTPFEVTWERMAGVYFAAENVKSIQLRLDGEERELEKYEHEGACYFGIPWQIRDFRQYIEEAANHVSN